MSLAGKVILITGATNGIGQAVARRCVEYGAQVVIHGRDQTRAECVVQELGNTASYVLGDLAEPDVPAQLIAKAIDRHGRLDGLVNNAAYMHRGQLPDVSQESFDQVLAINTRAPLLLAKEALPYLLKSEGSVVGVGSVNAYTGERSQLIYAMSKAAHATMSRNLADTYAYYRVRFNHLNVGWVLTDNEYALKQSEGFGPDWPDRVAGSPSVPSGRMTKPEEVAQHIAFWLSDQSRPISGSVVDLEQYPMIGRNPLKDTSS